MNSKAAWIFGGVVMLAGACDRDELVEVADEVELRDGWLNDGWLNDGWLNDGWLNDGWLNGFDLSGAPLAKASGGEDYVRVTGQTEAEVAVPDFYLVGSEVHIQKSNGTIKHGTEINNVKVDFDIKESGQLKHKSFRINSATLLSGDVWAYNIEYKVDSGPWTSACVDHNGNATQVIFISGVWDPANGARRQVASTGVTAACRGAALAKCVEMGYRPWASSSLQEYHQACTRMVRADYCGEGLPHTVAGTPIHVLDQIGLQNVAPNMTYVPEAEWGVNGATCLNSANTRLPDQAQGLSCQLPACGTPFSSGGIIQSGKIVSGS